MKVIPLLRGGFALVDDEDYEKLMVFNWSFKQEGATNSYAVRGVTSGGVRMFYMHREIMQPEAGVFIDHINGNGLDNRRRNLRLCDRVQNGQNRRKNRNGSSIYKGVSLVKPSGRYRAIIQVQKIRVDLGRYGTEREAAIAYNQAAEKYFGAFARLNEL